MTHGALTMLAATYTQGVRRLAMQALAVPEIAADEMLLRIRAASICGTDVRIVRNGHRKLRDGQRIVLGHEFVGTIEQLGERVEGYCVGQRVGVVPNAGCGRCDACVRGKANYCPTYTAFGIDRDGGHAEWVRIPGRFIAQGNVMVLPDAISDATPRCWSRFPAWSMECGRRGSSWVTASSSSEPGRSASCT